MEYQGKNFLIKTNDTYYGDLVIDLNDIIMRHQRAEYDHLRLHEYQGETEEEAQLGIALCFLSGVSLDILAGHGVPEAFLDEPTPMTVRAYRDDMFNRYEQVFDE